MKIKIASLLVGIILLTPSYSVAAIETVLVIGYKIQQSYVPDYVWESVRRQIEQAARQAEADATAKALRDAEAQAKKAAEEAAKKAAKEAKLRECLAGAGNRNNELYVDISHRLNDQRSDCQFAFAHEPEALAVCNIQAYGHYEGSLQGLENQREADNAWCKSQYGN